MEAVKILRLTNEINRSSIGRTTEQLGKLVIKEGWESYIAWGRTDGKSESIKIRIGNKLSVLFHVFITRFFDMHGYGSYFATKKFLKQLDVIRPDIVHLHDIHGYIINIGLLFRYLKENNIPVVWTHHDCWAYTGHCGFYSSVHCEEWKTECKRCPLYKAYPSSLVDCSQRNFKHKRYLFTSLEQLYNVGVSQWMCDELASSFMNKYPIERIYNGIDTKIFKPCPGNDSEIRKRYNLGSGVLLTAVATEWSPRKGLDDYLSLRKMLDGRYTMVFVGAPAELISSLPKGIVGIRRTDSQEELAMLYSASSIVLNLSSAESFGKTTPEGLACGVPSVVYNCTASPELVDENTGIVVEKGDLQGVKNAIEKIMTWNKQETVENCRKRACDLFSIDNNWPKYIDLYKQIIKSNKR